MAAYIEQKWGLPQCVGSIDGSHIPIIAPHRSAMLTTSIEKAGILSSFKVLWMEKDSFGACVQECLGVCMTLEF